MMRATRFIICCLLSCSLLSACGQTEGKQAEVETQLTAAPMTEIPTVAVTDKEAQTAPEIPSTEAQTQSTAAEATAGERKLTVQEAEFFESYVNQMGNYGFLLSAYDSPAGVDLEQVFYSGAGLEVAELSAQEQQAYLKAAGQDEIYTDVMHLTTEQIEKHLLEKTGLSYKDMEKPLPWMYIPEYDTYYHEAGDTNAVRWECVAGRVVNEQTYILQFQSEAYVPDCELVLERNADGYRFVSNEQLEAPEDGGINIKDISWQQAYIRVLQQLEEYWEGYELIYVDADDIPELVVIGGYEAAGCIIFNYYDGQVYETQLNRLNFNYIERENLLCNSDGNMDHYYDIVYSIIDGKMTQIGIGWVSVDEYPLQFDAEGNIIYKYAWNGVEMSKEEYEQAFNRVYNASKARFGYVWGEWYSAEKLIDVLRKSAAGEMPADSWLEDTVICVTSDGTRIAPRQRFAWGKTWTENSWLAADGLSLANDLPAIWYELPVLTSAEDFAVRCKDNVTVNGVTIYSGSFELLQNNADISCLQGLTEGVYYIIINASQQGRYIEKEKQYEETGYSCAYKLIVE